MADVMYAECPIADLRCNAGHLGEYVPSRGYEASKRKDDVGILDR